VTRITDNSITAVSLSGSVVSADALILGATRDRSLDAQSQGVTVGGIVVGVAQAKADAKLQAAHHRAPWSPKAHKFAPAST